MPNLLAMDYTQFVLDNLVTLTSRPFDPRSMHAMDYISINFGVHCSSHFPFYSAAADRQTRT